MTNKQNTLILDIIIVVVSVILFFSINGCTTPPWSEREIEALQQDNIQCVPLVKIEL